MDYLLNEDVTKKQGIEPKEIESFWDNFKKQFHERKSEKMIFGMPLYHIGKNAHGFFAVGLKARGVFSIGLMSRGIVSLGMLSLGVISIGLLSLGLISAGVFSAGLLAVGSIALGLFAARAISVGFVSVGVLSVGYPSTGALAVGKYAAVGEHAGLAGEPLVSRQAHATVPKFLYIDCFSSNWLEFFVGAWYNIYAKLT